MLFCGGDKLGIFLVIILVFITCSDFLFFATLLVIFMKNLCSLQTALMQQYNQENMILNKIQTNMNAMVPMQSHDTVTIDGEHREIPPISPTSPNSPNSANSPQSDQELSVISYQGPAQHHPAQHSAQHVVSRTASRSNMLRKHFRNKGSLTVDSRSKTVHGTIELSTFNVKEIISEYESTESSAKKESIERIIVLHKLAKKQFILASIAILSSTIYWLASFISTKIALLASWDILLNSICVWLMFGCSHKYWNLCCKYFCCWLCYMKLNKMDKIIEEEQYNKAHKNYSNQFKRQPHHNQRCNNHHQKVHHNEDNGHKYKVSKLEREAIERMDKQTSTSPETDADMNMDIEDIDDKIEMSLQSNESPRLEISTAM